MSTVATEQTPDDQPHTKLSFADWVSFAALLIVGGGTFFMMQWFSYVESERANAFVLLASTSKAHEYVVPAYRECLRSRNPGHVACKGAVAKSAEMNGFSDKEVVRVFLDIEVLSAEHE